MHTSSTNRRDFLGKITSAAALLTIGNFAAAATPLAAHAANPPKYGPDEWLRANLKGKRKAVIDANNPKSDHIFSAPKIFLMGNEETGVPANDCSTLLVLRGEAFIYALQDAIWEKYKFGEQHELKDPRTGANTTRNPFWQTKADDFKIPGFGAVPLGIRDHQASGVQFCVCGIALTVHSAAVAAEAGRSEAEVKKEWMDALIPGIQVMPSGVFAISRAQEYGCAYLPG